MNGYRPHRDPTAPAINRSPYINRPAAAVAAGDAARGDFADLAAAGSYGSPYPGTAADGRPAATGQDAPGESASGDAANRPQDPSPSRPGDPTSGLANAAAQPPQTTLPQGMTAPQASSTANGLTSSAPDRSWASPMPLHSAGPTTTPQPARLNPYTQPTSAAEPDDAVAGRGTQTGTAASSQSSDPNRDDAVADATASPSDQAVAESAEPTRANGAAKQAAAHGAMAQAPRLQSRPPDSTPAGSPPVAASSSLVERRGRDWALPRSIANTRGNKIVRTIRVECHPDRFVLLPPQGRGATQVFGFSDGQVDRAALQLATAIRDRVDRWGAAIPGGRWQPRLDVQVMPRGDARFHQLRTLFNGSGVEIEGRAAP
jgi:hypothetical protein